MFIYIDLLSRVGRGTWPNDAAATDHITIAKWGENFSPWRNPVGHGANSIRKTFFLTDERCEVTTSSLFHTRKRLFLFLKKSLQQQRLKRPVSSHHLLVLFARGWTAADSMFTLHIRRVKFTSALVLELDAKLLSIAQKFNQFL
jgi:hypothetical protein